MPGPANSINEVTTGICGFTGTAFTGTAVTNHAVIIGGSTSSTLTNVGPSATAGQVLQSGGASADPSYSTATYPSTAGTNGNVLTSNGTNWTSVAPSSGGISTVTGQRVTATGAFTYTPTSGMKYVIVELVGGGGGSGAVPVGVAAAASGGGGAGYARFILTAAQVGASLTGSVGAGGTGGAAGNNNGNAGASTTLATSSPWTAAGGGAGLVGATNTFKAGGAGGTVTTGTGTVLVTTTGSAGGTGFNISTLYTGGSGGNSHLGFGAVSNELAPGSSSVGISGTLYGSGASGAVGLGVAIAGADGTAGIAIFTEFN